MKAFPATHPSEKYQFVDSGMDLRDYFAAKIMVSLMREYHDDLDWNAHENAHMAYEIADAMMKARDTK